VTAQRPFRPWGSLTDVPGVAVGHAQRIGDGWLSGVTVVVPPRGTVHTMLDGDAVFALATGTVAVSAEDHAALQVAAGDAVLLAVLDAVLAARGVRTTTIDVPGYLDLCPSTAP
jgi:L-aminopeptidase/D-esterase-like protein